MHENTEYYKGFAPISLEAWQKSIEAQLKAGSLEDLSREIEPGITIAPFPGKEGTEHWASFSYLSQEPNTWLLAERISIENEKQANAQALEALQGGAEMLVFDAAGKDWDWEALFSEVYLNMIRCHITNLAEPKGLEAYYQSLGSEAKQGFFLLGQAGGSQPRLALQEISSLPPESKASERIAFALKEAQRFLQSALAQGQSLREASQRLCFSWTVGPRYFVEIAVLRSLRVLYYKLLEGLGATEVEKPWIAARTQRAEYAETHWSFLSSSTQAMSAVLGGVSSLEISPAQGDDPSFYSRMARNLQHLLRMESFFERVSDPAAGAYYIETLSQKLSEKAWAAFLASQKA